MSTQGEPAWHSGSRINLDQLLDTKGSIDALVRLTRLPCFGLVESVQRNLKDFLRIA